MTNLLSRDIEVFQGRRSRGGILENAYPLPDGWENGVTFRTVGCTAPELALPCAVLDSADVNPDMEVFEPIWIRQNAQCSTLSKIGSVDRATQRLEATTEYGLGRLLQAGAGSVNPILDDATSVHEVDDPTGNLPLQLVDVISCLEQAVADVGYGADVFLHAPPRVAAYVRAANLIDDDGYSPAGHPWIFSSGYQPTVDVAGDTLWINATGSIWADVTDSYTLEDGITGRPPVGWRTNDDSAFRQRLGLAIFDSCLNLRATMTAPTCVGGS